MRCKTITWRRRFSIVAESSISDGRPVLPPGRLDAPSGSDPTAVEGAVDMARPLFVVAIDPRALPGRACPSSPVARVRPFHRIDRARTGNEPDVLYLVPAGRRCAA